MTGRAGSFHPNVHTGYWVNQSSFLVGGNIFAPGVEKQDCDLATSVSVVPCLRMYETMSSRPTSTPLPVLHVTVTTGNVVDISQLVSSSLRSPNQFYHVNDIKT
jgi:hypothetical protein